MPIPFNGVITPLRRTMVPYKRRKKSKAEDGVSTRHFFGQVSQEVSYAPRVLCDECSIKKNRNVVLAQIYQSLEGEGGLKSCIEDFCGAGNDGNSHSADMHVGTQKGDANMVPNGSVNGSNNNLVTETSQSTILKLINSDRFSELCSLLVENGIDAGKLMDLSRINSRMKERAYESSPLLLHSDIQEVWMKLQKVGTNMLALAKSMADQTLTSFRGQVGISSNGISTGHTFEETNIHKGDNRETSDLDEVRICRQCREKTDGKNCLVCDSCEEMHHISCIQPAVKEIPSRSWYCTNCVRTGNDSPHDDCEACDRLDTITPSFDRNDFVYDEEAEEQLKDRRGDELRSSGGSKRLPDCKICKTEVRNKQDYRICGHSFCPHKFYHAKCLTSEQLTSHGPCWYCPSCLCRSCFVDRDDDKIVLCDGCDHAYHMYCMDPPRTTVPKGDWFCQICCDGMSRLRKARRSFEKVRNKCKKRSANGDLKSDEALNKSGGVDMLLNAAKTLNCGEN